MKYDAFHSLILVLCLHQVASKLRGAPSSSNNHGTNTLSRLYTVRILKRDAKDLDPSTETKELFGPDLSHVGFTDLHTEIKREDNDYLRRLMKKSDFNQRLMKKSDYEARLMKKSDYEARLMKKSDFGARLMKKSDYDARLMKKPDFGARLMKKSDYDARLMKKSDFAARLMKKSDYGERLMKKSGYIGRLMKRSDYLKRLMKRSQNVQGDYMKRIMKRGSNNDDVHNDPTINIMDEERLGMMNDDEANMNDDEAMMTDLAESDDMYYDIIENKPQAEFMDDDEIKKYEF